MNSSKKGLPRVFSSLWACSFRGNKRLCLVSQRFWRAQKRKILNLMNGPLSLYKVGGTPIGYNDF